MDKKRLVSATVSGAVLGVLCIVGVGFRQGYSGNMVFLLATWYNRVVMGFLIGLAGDIQILDSKYNRYFRGLFLGIFVSAAVFLSTGFRDPPSMAAGMVYGIIIDVVATRFS